MRDVTRAMQLWELNEGRRRFPYDDRTGKPLAPGDTLKGNLTIGCGRNLSRVGLRDHEITIMMRNDLCEADEDLRQHFRWTQALSDAQYHALLDLRCQLGPSGFRTFNRPGGTLYALAAGELRKACAGLRASKWARQVPARAVRIIRMLETGQWPEEIG